jgi:hypothetical protein
VRCALDGKHARQLRKPLLGSRISRYLRKAEEARIGTDVYNRPDFLGIITPRRRSGMQECARKVHCQDLNCTPCSDKPAPTCRLVVPGRNIESTYAVWIEAVNQWLAGYLEAIRRACCEETARRTYGLD